MRTRFSSHPSLRTVRPDSALAGRAQTRAPWNATRRLTLALAASAPLCAGALMAGPAQAAPTVESDENGPLVQIIKPGYNDVLKGKYRILIQVTARKYNPQSVEMFIDDQSATTGPMEISSFASSSYDFDTRLLSEGRHKLTVRVTDSQGFRGWSEVTVFVNNKGIVDTQVPDLRWVGIQPFQELSGSIKLEVNAADNFGVKMLQISINPADSPNKPAYSWMMNQPPYSVNLDTIKKNIPDGLYILKALAFDSLDQQGEAAPLTIGIVNDQISATRVQDMLDGRRQMSKVLAGETLTTPSTQKAATQTTENPATVLPAATPVAPVKIKAPTPVEQVAPSVAETAEPPAPLVADASSARSSVPETETRTMPQSIPVPSQLEAATTPPRVTSPAPRVTPQKSSNPGIQLPRVNVPATAMPQDVTPEIDASTQGASTNEQTLVDGATTEIASTEIAPNAEISSTQPTTAAIEVAPQRSEVARIAMNPSAPVSQRTGGQASLSRAAVIELAVAAPGGAVIESARSSQPIAVARFSQPSLTGRNITDAPVLSQSSASDESRLSNAELSRLRSSKTRVLSAVRPLINAGISQPKSARALQTSAPSLALRPILGRAVSADLVSPPAPKLTREVQNAALTAPKTARPALSGSLSKTVLASQRLAPVTSATPPKGTAPAVASAATRGMISKAVSASHRALPIEIAPVSTKNARTATTLVAKNSATHVPQMSAPSKPRMSESASGLNVPQRIAATKTLDNQRLAALPRPDAATANRSGATIVAVPLNTPLEIADSNMMPVPSSYRAERNTTLRAVAARFGLPVELVAISNNLTTDARVTSGTEVKLPRPLQVSYNGVPVKGDAPSLLMGDTAVTAFRFMFERTGGKMEWDATNQRVVARKDGREITLTIGSNVAKIGEREVMMEIAAFLFQGRTMVPLRFFEEGLNAQVEWNPQTGRLVVAMAG